MDIFSENILNELNSFALHLTKGDQDFADDVMQRMWEKRILPRAKRDRRSLTLDNYTLSFLKSALKYAFLDEYRSRNRRREIQVVQTPSWRSEIDPEPDLEAAGDFAYHLERLRPSDRQFLKHYEHKNRHSSSERKRYSRINQTLKAQLIYSWLKKREYFVINRFRVADAICQRIADMVVLYKDSPDFLFETFTLIDYNRLIQTVSGILFHLSKADYLYQEAVLQFMRERILSGSLYRGNTTYLADRILDMDTRESLNLFADYLNLLPDYRGRVTNAAALSANEHNIRSRCIFDIKKISLLDEREIDPAVLNRLILLFENDSNIDLHRTVTLQLLRCQYDPRLIQRIIRSMPDDPDQTNAYYIAKFIRLYGRKHPAIISSGTLEALEATNKKWPMNRYIRDLKNDVKKML